MRRQSVVYISSEAHRLLSVIAAKRGRKLGQWVEDCIYHAAMRDLGDEVHEVVGAEKEYGDKVFSTSSNTSEGAGGSLGEAEEREDVLGS